MHGQGGNTGGAGLTTPQPDIRTARKLNNWAAYLVAVGQPGAGQLNSLACSCLTLNLAWKVKISVEKLKLVKTE